MAEGSCVHRATWGKIGWRGTAEGSSSMKGKVEPPRVCPGERMTEMNHWDALVFDHHMNPATV